MAVPSPASPATVSSVVLAPESERACHAKKPFAPVLPEMPQADAFHHRKDWRPQVSVRPMRRRRSNANARHTGLDHKLTATAQTTVGPSQLTHQHSERTERTQYRR